MLKDDMFNKWIAVADFNFGEYGDVDINTSDVLVRFGSGSECNFDDEWPFEVATHFMVKK